jgi:DNA polymerase-4
VPADAAAGSHGIKEQKFFASFFQKRRIFLLARETSRVTTPALCRDCGTVLSDAVPACPACHGRRILAHPELLTLAIAHIDCDAFFASVEKRDRPELAGKPVIVGGGTRGVVTTCCYIARLDGVASAMPMFKALKLCPGAVVIRPDFTKYAEAARRIRALMLTVTPLVQPLSIDEAALDLSGTAALHKAPPAATLARLARRIEAEIGVTVSIGLAGNRMLAKLAAGQDKPRGFAVLGADAAARLAPLPVGVLPGVGPVQEKRLARLGVTRVGQLQALTEAEAVRLLGTDGPSLARRARGEDTRVIDPEGGSKSISAETTFNTDLADRAALERVLWTLAERLAKRLREKEYAAAGVVLKLKTARFVSRTRAQRLAQPSCLPDRLFAAAAGLLAREADGTAFRLIGIGASGLVPIGEADRGDLADPDAARLVARQGAIDALRGRFGEAVIGKGRGLPHRK